MARSGIAHAPAPSAARPRPISLAFVQYGDFAEASARLGSGGDENYYAQRHSVEFVERISAELSRTMVLSLNSAHERRTLDSGVETAGVRLYEGHTIADVTRALEAWAPTHVVLRTPEREVVSWCLARNIRVLPTLADSFPVRGLRARFRNRRLARVLNDPRIDFVANHHINSSANLAAIGVRPDRIIPWDWPAQARPHDRSAKRVRAGGAAPLRLGVIGKADPAKGLPDCIAALPLLASAGIHAELHIAGGVTDSEIAGAVQAAGASGRVFTHGRMAHSAVIEFLRGCDVALVPSRHEYPEGLPMAIYDAFSSRTPLVASDHPMFAGRVVNGESGLTFRAGDAADLACTIARLAGDAALYARLSEGSLPGWERLQLPVEWTDLVRRWLEGTPEEAQWLREHTLATGRYAHLMPTPARAVRLKLPEPFAAERR